MHHRKNVLPATANVRLWIIRAIRRIVQESPMTLKSRVKGTKDITKIQGGYDEQKIQN